MENVVQELQEAYKTSEEKVNKLCQYLTKTEKILLDSEVICKLPEDIHNFNDSVIEVKQKYESFSNLEKKNELILDLKEHRVKYLFESVIRKISYED